VKPLTLTTHSPEETRRLGAAIGHAAQPGDVVCLHADLGAGKTVLVQGIAQGLGVEEAVTSPSFALIHHHQGRLHLRHIDLYRLSPDEARDLGLEELLEEPGVSAIEWSELLPENLVPDCLMVKIEHGRRENDRKFTLRAVGPHAERLLAALREGR